MPLASQPPSPLASKRNAETDQIDEMNQIDETDQKDETDQIDQID